MTWLRFDPDEFWDSDEVAVMDLEPAALLWFMICRSWKTGGMKDDPAHWKRLTLGRTKRFEALWPTVRGALDLVDGELRCPWLEQKRSDAIGRLSSDAERKRQKRLSERQNRVCPSDVQSEHNGRPKPVVRASTPTDGQDGQDRTDGQFAAPPPASAHHAAIAVWCECFHKVTGQEYGFDGGKDGKHIKAILGFAKGDLEVIRNRALILLNAAPGWIDEGGKDLGTLRSQWNKLVSQQTGQATGSKLLAVQEANGRTQSGSVKLEPLPTTKRLY